MFRWASQAIHQGCAWHLVGDIAAEPLADNTPSETCRTIWEYIKNTTATYLHAISSFRESFNYNTPVLLAPSLHHLVWINDGTDVVHDVLGLTTLIMEGDAKRCQGVEGCLSWNRISGDVILTWNWTFRQGIVLDHCTVKTCANDIILTADW